MISMKTLKQELLWMPTTSGGESSGGKSGRTKTSYPYNTRPFRLWSLYLETDQGNPPHLPFTAMHMKNAFLEDFSHDYFIKDSEIFFCSRVTGGGHWILLEFKT